MSDHQEPDDSHKTETALLRELSPLRERVAELEVYSRVFEHLPQGVSVWFLEDPDDVGSFRFVACNPDNSRTVGVSLEEQVRGAQRLESVGRLAGGIAHNFNNMLCVIQGHTEFLLDAERPSRADVLGIQESANRAAALTKQLLAFSRRQTLRPEILRVDAVVKGFTALLEPLIGEDVELVTRFAGEPLYVNADKGQLEQLLMNLAVNARDAMPTGGTFRIETGSVCLDDDFVRGHPGALPGPFVMLAVGDSGSGMDENTLAQIFEPFFTTKPAGEGTGLGLSTAYGIVKQSGGSIWAESEVGRGTTFRIYLPRVQPADAKRKRGDTRSALTGTECVLLVENVEPIRRLVHRTLRRQGYTVLEASGAREAEQVWNDHDGRIDLLLTDVVMLQTSGVELAARLRQLRSDLRVLYMSGHVGHPSVERAMLEEGANLVSKPFTDKTLLTKVRETLD